MIKSQQQALATLSTLIETVLENGKVNRQEYMLLTIAALADQQASDVDRQQINRVFDYIQAGQIKIID